MTRIGELAAELLSARQTITSQEGIGLTTLYNAIDEGAWQPIARLHADLDHAVLKAYDMPTSLREDPLELKVQLAALHADISAGRRTYMPFDWPGN